MQLKDTAGGLLVRYRWKADVPGFDMPLRITPTKDKMGFIHPTPDEQTKLIPGMTASDLRIDTQNFCIQAAGLP